MDEHFSFIRSFQYSYEAQIFKGKLESEGIEVYLRDDVFVDTNPFYSNAVGGVKLYVKRQDFTRAIKALSDISKYSLDDNNELMICAKCGSNEIEMRTTIKDFKTLVAFIFSSLFVTIPLYSKYKYKCNKCNFEF